MPGVINFETFLLTGILLNLTPGNDTLFILSRSIAQGKAAGMVSVLGISTGSLIHTTLAAFGLSIIIAQSILFFNIIKYAGAAYLFYIGIKMIIGSPTVNAVTDNLSVETNLKKIYSDAVLTNVLNPKVAMFFIAFLPQFIDSHYRYPVFPFFALGITFTVTGLIWCSILSVFASKIFSGLRKKPAFSLYLNKACGFILIGLGIKVAMASRK